MGIINKIFRREKQPRFAYTQGAWAIPPGWNTQSYLQSYGQIGWLFGCVSRIAVAVADVQWRLNQVRGNDKKELFKHPLLDMLDYVNPFQTGQELFELSQMYLDLVGESFWVLNRNKAGIPAEIWIAPPDRMQIVPSKEQFISGYVYQFSAEKVPLEIEEVIHIKYPNPSNPYRGIGPAQSIAVDLDCELYSSQWNRNFFYNDASPGLVVSYPDNVPEEDYERLLEQWKQRHGGVAKAHKVAIISGGAKIDRTMISQRDMDFWRLRKVNRDTILGAYGMPLTILGVEGPGSRARAEADAYIFARYVIKPRLTRFREKLNEQLCPMFGQGLELDFDDPVPENREQLITEADTGVRAGYLTINEARQMLGFDAVPRGDVFVMPMTMIPTPAKGMWTDTGPRALPPGIGPPLLLGQRILSARAFGMNEEAKAAYWQSFAAKSEAQEKPFIRTLKELFGAQETEVLGLLQDADNPKEALFDEDKAEERFRKALTPHLRSVLAEAAEDAEALIHPEPAHRGKQDYPLSGDALIWLMDRAAWLVKGINKTTRDAISVQLVDGFAEGESIPKLAARVRSVFDDCSTRRSLVIARTEVIAASNEGALAGYEASGVVEKVEFYAAIDELNEDCECRDYHTNTYSLKEAGGIIPVHPNCRCTWLPIVE